MQRPHAMIQKSAGGSTQRPLLVPCTKLRVVVHRSPSRRISCQLQMPQVTEVKVAPRSPEPAAAPPAPAAPATVPADAATLHEMWPVLAAQHGDRPALIEPHAHPAPCEFTYAEVAQLTQQFAAGLSSLGLQHGDVVSLFSENSARWLLADQGIMAVGAADAVRGVSSSVEELAYIMQSSQSSALVVQDAATLDKLLPVLAPGSSSGSAGEGYSPLQSSIRFVVLLHGVPRPEAKAALGGRPALTFDEVLARGAPLAATWQAPAVAPTDLATIIYTSGTSGHPKGVMLSHSNLMYQVRNLGFFLQVEPGHRTLSLLPPWHVYERSCSYYVLSCGATQVFTKLLKFRDDLQAYPPDFFVCVPLVLDSLHSKVMATLKKASAVRRVLATSLLAAAAAYVRARRVVDGLALQYATTPRPLLAFLAAWLRCRLLAPLHWLAQVLVVKKVRAAVGIKGGVVSGGGSLAAHLDDFYEAIGLPVINGWGLTETSPVLACRRMVPGGNVRGSVGVPTPGTELRVVDPETRQDLPDGEKGLILARGPGVTKGYHNDAAATAKAFIAGDGWFDTGDLGWRVPGGVAGSNMAGCIVLTGRAKDTIVLTSGENVEPQPIEDVLCCSPYIKHAMLIGQGHSRLGALIVTDPDALADLAASKGVEELSAAEVRELVGSEIRTLLADRIRWEHVAAFTVLSEPFSVDNGTLTRTMKLRRQAIVQHYVKDMQALEQQLH